MITNTHTPDTTKKKVKKVWNDHGNKDGIRPKSVLVNLLADGKSGRNIDAQCEE